MSVKAYETLFHLIKSMSKTEKRYFRLYASMHVIGKQNGYIKLYEYIARQKHYDEERLKKELCDEPFISRLPAVKNYLHKLILKSMRSYHTDGSAEMFLRNLLADADYLHGKALYASCLKTLGKAKSIAVAQDKFDVLIGILRRESKVIYQSEGFSTRKGKLQIEKCGGELADAIKKVNNIIEYEKSATQIYALYSQAGKPRDKERMKKLTKIIKGPLYRNDRYPLSFTAKLLFYECNGLYADIRSDFSCAYRYRKKRLELLESHPERLAENAWAYLGSLNNLIIQVMNLRRYKEIFPIIEKMRNIPGRIPSADTEDFRVKTFIISSTSEMSGLIEMAQFEICKKQIPEVELGIVKYKGKIPSIFEHVLYFNIAYVYFALGDYRKAIISLNRILNTREADVSQAIFCYARIFNIILHYELHHEELLFYLNKSTSLFLSKRKRLYRTEIAILNFFRITLPGSSGNKEITNAFRGLKNEISKIIKDPFEAKITEHYDLISWIESKIENKSFLEIVKAKAKDRRFCSV